MTHTMPYNDPSQRCNQLVLHTKQFKHTTSLQRMRPRPIMTNSPYYRSANKTIQISRSPKHIQVGLPDKNNQHLFTKFSANFHALQDFLPVTTEKNLSGRLN